MYSMRYIHHWIKQLNPVLIKIAIHFLNLYDWPLKEIISAIESLVTKREKSFSSGRSCRPHKITVDYTYTVISGIFSWEAERKWTGGKKITSRWCTRVIWGIHFSSPVRSFPKLLYLLPSPSICLVTGTMWGAKSAFPKSLHEPAKLFLFPQLSHSENKLQFDVAV